MIDTILKPGLERVGTPHRKVKVAILALHQWGGVAYYGCLLANALGQHVQAMVIISEEMSGFRFAPMLQVEIIKKDKILFAPNPLAYRRIFNLVKIFDPDLVHDTAGNACKWTFGLWPLLARHWPLVITEHDPQPHPGMGGFFPHLTRHIAWKSADHLITHGPKCQQALLAAGIPKHKVSINRHGSFNIYNQQNYRHVTEDKDTVLFFGELRPNKGVYRLLPIARQVRVLFPSAKFIVAGKRTQLPGKKEVARVYAAIAALKSEPGFEVYDRFIDNVEVEYFFRRTAVVILPYHEASQSGIIPLAYAFRKPVIAFDVGDLGESVLAGKTGILVPGGDEEAFARAIVALLRDTAGRHEMGRSAYEWAQKELSWDLIARRTTQIYNQVIFQ